MSLRSGHSLTLPWCTVIHRTLARRIGPVVALALAVCLAAPGVGQRKPAHPLDQRVDLAFARPPLAQVLLEMRRQSQVEFTCDPILSTRRVVVLADHRSLREVMQQISRFTGTPPGLCEWDTREEGRAYHLRESRRS